MIKDNLQLNESVKPNTAFLDELRNKLPEFFNDEGFDIEKFQNALKENNVNEFSEGYQLNFIGKDYARKQAGDAPTSVIVPDNEHNQKEENKNSKNLFFTGDNLEVLRHLRNNYSNKIDVIYIDPPYNTGNDDFIYPDKFEYSDKQLEEVFGMTQKDISKLKALKRSKSHSAWLTFMYPRLWLAKQLLADDGVIFVSIDDNELSNLKLLMDEIYGESNFINNISIKMSELSGVKMKNLNKYPKLKESLLIYSSNRPNLELEIEKVPKASSELMSDKLEKYLKYYSNILLNKDSKLENWKIIPLKDYIKKEGLVFNNSDELLKWKMKNAEKLVYRTNSKTVEKFVEKNPSAPSIYKFVNNDGKVIYKWDNKELLFLNKYLEEYIGDIWNDISTINLNSEMHGITQFSNAQKPLSLIKRILKSVKKNKETVLDFFAGSATTADAVMQLNAEDGGSRKFIMVQLPEKTYELDKNGNKKPTKGGKVAFDAGYMSIDEISRERIKRAAKKIKDENPGLNEDFDGGFKHYRVVSPEKETLDKIYDFDPENYELVSDMVDSFSSSALGVPGNASGEDTILTTWLAEDGYDFNTDDLVEYDFAGYKALGIKDTRLYLIDGNLHSEQIKELLNQLGTNKVKFQSIVVYGYSFNVMDMKELERGLSQLNSKVNLIKRY